MKKRCGCLISIPSLVFQAYVLGHPKRYCITECLGCFATWSVESDGYSNELLIKTIEFSAKKIMEQGGYNSNNQR